MGGMRPWLKLCESAFEALASLRARRSRNSADRRKQLGDAGERRAYFYLRRHGYTVVARQWRAPHVDGEIDLIAWQGETLCFVEVKTRSERDRFAPERAVNTDKQQTIRRMARAYLRGLFQDDQPRPLIRFDVVTVLPVGETWRVDLQPGTAFQAT